MELAATSVRQVEPNQVGGHRFSRVSSVAASTRAMLDEQELHWLAESVAEPVEHLLIGATLPMLMVPGIHHLEGWNEALAAGRYGAPRGAVVWMRQAVDLEHWAAFRRTFSTVMEILDGVAAREDAPASIAILSGDVPLLLRRRSATAANGFQPPRVSPTHDVALPQPTGTADSLGKPSAGRRLIKNLLQRLADHARVERVPVEWEITEGLWFDNGVMTVVIHGREAKVLIDHAHVPLDDKYCNARQPCR